MMAWMAWRRHCSVAMKEMEGIKQTEFLLTLLSCHSRAVTKIAAWEGSAFQIQVILGSRSDSVECIMHLRGHTQANMAESVDRSRSDVGERLWRGGRQLKAKEAWPPSSAPAPTHTAPCEPQTFFPVQPHCQHLPQRLQVLRAKCRLIPHRVHCRKKIIVRIHDMSTSRAHSTDNFVRFSRFTKSKKG